MKKSLFENSQEKQQEKNHIMPEETEQPEIERIGATSDSMPGLTYQSITDGEYQKANAAYKEFELGNFERCLKGLKSLQLSRPQDIKVFHNVCVAEYYLSKCCNIADLYSHLLSACRQANIDVQDIESIDDVDQCVIFFNRAVILFHLYKYCGAIHILDKVFQFIEPLDEALGQRICFLLLELYLCTYQPKKALGLIAYIESMLLSSSAVKSNKSPDKDENKSCTYIDELKLKLVQAKARCYTMTKTAKPCKREVKALLVSGSKVHHIAAFIIKSQLEYQRGNYRKAIKILNSPEWPNDYTKYFMETGDCLQAIYYNNLSCIHYHMGKPSLGAFYSEQGLKELDLETTKLQHHDKIYLSQPLHTLSVAIRKKLVYNLGMQHFQREKYQEAFACFLQVSECYCENSRLWLRIAECCIQIHRQNIRGGSTDFLTAKSVIGTVEHRKIILNSVNETSARQIIEYSKDPAPTLPFALCSLRNALMLLPKEKITSEVKSSTLRVDERDVNPLEECLQVPPCNTIPLATAHNLRSAILLALSYVSLRLGNLILAHDYAVQVLSQPRLSTSHRYLAHMYAGEALVYLDKVSQAVEHFNQDLFSGSTETLLVSSEDQLTKCYSKGDTPDRADDSDRFSKLKSVWCPGDFASAELIAQYNLSVVYALRGEWSKALHLATEVIHSEGAPSEAMALIAYIHLCQGDTAVALSYLNNTMNLHQK